MLHLQGLHGACQITVAADEPGECSSRGLYEGEFFPGIGRIPYEGPESKNPLAFHYYNADEDIMGKPMKDWSAPAHPACHCFPGDCICILHSNHIQSLTWILLNQAALQRGILAHPARRRRRPIRFAHEGAGVSPHAILQQQPCRLQHHICEEVCVTCMLASPGSPGFYTIG